VPKAKLEIVTTLPPLHPGEVLGEEFLKPTAAITGQGLSARYGRDGVRFTQPTYGPWTVCIHPTGKSLCGL
jgi:hypothetical protein